MLSVVEIGFLVLEKPFSTIYPQQKVHQLVNHLFRAKTRAAIEVQLECARKLLTTVGGNFDVGKSKRGVNSYFRVEKNRNKKRICSPVKFALKDLVALHSRGGTDPKSSGNA